MPGEAPRKWDVAVRLSASSPRMTAPQASEMLSQGRRILIEVTALDGTEWTVAYLGTSDPPRRAWLEVAPLALVGDDLSHESIEAVRDAIALGWRIVKALPRERGGPLPGA